MLLSELEGYDVEARVVEFICCSDCECMTVKLSSSDLVMTAASLMELASRQ